MQTMYVLIETGRIISSYSDAYALGKWEGEGGPAIKILTHNENERI